ncbi:carboxylesterase [Planomicrobium sp. CPCC 101079]|uniref:alpha/beta hydrolase n=1 Tax=Planomicrobium sp. CPCC 101079 TaxID=2599618 RepID=UPI0011B58871|nr:alpha/beta fold hydrolase [Planomicrobium sp. CPCC 101079]TWT02211.1 alpha/beta fold hydrolase [Planomicrobium sp. CPCC 101079]
MKTGVLCIHGFTGGPYEVQPFAEFIERQTDWAVKIPTLPGHGETLALKKMTADHWLMEAELALRELKKEADRIIIVGFSMGGLIALYLAMRYKIDKLVLLSAAAKYISVGQIMQEVRGMAADAVKWKLAENEIFWHYQYKLLHTPLLSTFEFLKVVKLVSPYYKSIHVPVCLVHGLKDGIVPVTASEFIYDNIASEEKLVIHSATGRHLICYSDDCEDWFKRVLDFMKKLEE